MSGQAYVSIFYGHLSKKKLKIFLKIYFEWGFRFWSFTYTNQEEPFGSEVPDHHVRYCPFSRAMGVYMGGH